VTTYAPQSTNPKDPFWAVTGSHLAGALVTFGAAVNAHWPNRDHASDGYIGDARHVAEGSGSDHNPWLNHTVRADDVDKDGIDADWLAEQLRLLGAAGDHRLVGGGYVIWNKRITKPDFSGWDPYHGADDHTGHLHLSLTRNPAGYDDNRTPWTFFAGTTAQPAAQPAHPTWTPGKDATGSDTGFRAHYGDEGPKIEHLQHELNEFAPAYSHLVEDGVYGDQTAAVLDEFSERAAHEAATPVADRQPLIDSDGRDVGARTARALDRHGLI
jgi:hypothetical protein